MLRNVAAKQVPSCESPVTGGGVGHCQGVQYQHNNCENFSSVKEAHLLLHIREDLALESLHCLERLVLVLASEGHRLSNNTGPLLKASSRHRQVHGAS